MTSPPPPFRETGGGPPPLSGEARVWNFTESKSLKARIPFRGNFTESKSLKARIPFRGGKGATFLHIAINGTSTLVRRQVYTPCFSEANENCKGYSFGEKVCCLASPERGGGTADPPRGRDGEVNLRPQAHKADTAGVLPFSRRSARPRRRTKGFRLGNDEEGPLHHRPPVRRAAVPLPFQGRQGCKLIPEVDGFSAHGPSVGPGAHDRHATAMRNKIFSTG